MSEEVSGVTVVEQEPDVVQVMRTWTVTAPDWTPQYRSRAIAPTKVVAIWIDGVINRASVSGPYRMKSGKVSTDEGGTGNPDYRADQHRMIYIGVRADDTWDKHTRDDFPDWAEAFITANAPTDIQVH